MNYASDLTNDQWELIEGIVYVGASAKIGRRLLMNAVFYVTKTGCQWRQLPKDFPKWKTVYSFFMRIQRRNIWEKIMDALVIKSRENIIDLDESSIAIDSQSVKTNGKFKKKGLGFMWDLCDGYKIIKGIKRSIAVDQYENILSIDITSANEHDSSIGIRVLCDSKRKYDFDIVIADKGFRGRCVDYVNDILGKTIHIRNKIGKHSRNVVEKVLGWFTHYNRLNKCYEYTISSAKSMIQIASIMIMLKRLR